jgi:aspartyl-tRNA(Asn)/glutamyl-tRNA(Gln) amidotransferase subunit C
MEKITKEMLEQLAVLTKLSFNEEEKDKLLVDFQNMLDCMNKIREFEGSYEKVELDDVAFTNGEVVEGEDISSEFLKNAPSVEDVYIKVPLAIAKQDMGEVL